MKKIILLIFLVLVGCKVEAATYYSDYSEYSDYTDVKVQASDTTEVEEVEMYELYRENVTYETSEEPRAGEDGEIIKMPYPWVSNIFLVDQTKEIEKMYLYDLPLLDNYQSIRVINPTNRQLKIESLKIYNYTDELDLYEMENIILYPDDRLFLYIYEHQNLAYLKIEIDIVGYDDIDEDIKIGLYVSHEPYDLEYGELVMEKIGTKEELYLLIDDFSKYLAYPKDINYQEVELGFLLGNVKKYETRYRNVLTYYRYKTTEKEYTGEYALSDKDNLSVDLTHNKTFYRYRTRDKVTISDDLTVTSKIQELSNFIEYSSIDLNNIKITSNVNYQKNGIYQINFILPFKTISKDIKVNIEENYIDLINEQANYINSLTTNVMESNYAVDKKNLEIKEVIIEEENKYQELAEELNSCYNDKKELEDQKEILKEEKIVKQQSIGYIYVLLLLIVLLLACRKKVFKKIS